jgi:hypothetical protein
MYTVYNLITGQIKRHVKLPDVNPGEGVIEGQHSLDKFYVKRNVVIPIPPQLFPNTVFDYLLERWVDVAWQDTEGLIAIRNRMLRDSDWTDTASFRNRVGDQLADAWLDYRQQLRDITKLPGFPMDFYWPEPPK